MKTITFYEAKKLSNENGYIIVDLRNRSDYDNGHIENAINIPGGDIRVIEQYKRKELTWVLYCQRGSLSFKLASIMEDRGYKVLAVVGGFRR